MFTKDEIMFDPETKIENATLETVKDLIGFGNSLSNIACFAAFAVYFRNDETEIEAMDAAFSKSGILYENRSIKAKAKKIFDNMKNGKAVYVAENQSLSLTAKEIVEHQFNDLPFTFSTVYQATLNAEKSGKVKTDNSDMKAAKAAIDNPAIETGPVKSAKQLLELASMGIAEFQNALAQGKESLALERLADDLPPASDSLALTIVKGYLAEFYNAYPAQFQAVTDFIMELQTAPPAIETEAEEILNAA